MDETRDRREKLWSLRENHENPNERKKSYGILYFSNEDRLEQIRKEKLIKMKSLVQKWAMDAEFIGFLEEIGFSKSDSI